MKKIILLLATIGILVASCKVTLKPVTTVENGNLSDYKYIYISPTNSLTSSSGGTTIYGQYYSSGKSVNPIDVIAGRFLKEGFIRLLELNPDLMDETMVVNYGESGRRDVARGYTIEVTIQVVSAQTSELVCSCTGEGFGETEVDDIRIAITRCLSGLFSD